MEVIRKLLRRLNVKLRIVETNVDQNAYYAWADARLDELAARAHPKLCRRRSGDPRADECGLPYGHPPPHHPRALVR